MAIINFESGIKWECLIETVCHVQIHVLRQSTVVGVEVLVVPLNTLALQKFLHFAKSERL